MFYTLETYTISLSKNYWFFYRCLEKIGYCLKHQTFTRTEPMENGLLLCNPVPWPKIYPISGYLRVLQNRCSFDRFL